ncbi:aldehyde dehydrogenase family protein [Kutzneria sp. NPDC051319]|uniref:aldehyde dehydrogenase family protein n=1 Tax=Kutzneria sp. NPDC051319 TaxID=3155047 RepID=UPI0034467C9E
MQGRPAAGVRTVFEAYADMAAMFPFVEHDVPRPTGGGGVGACLQEAVGVVAAIVPWNGPGLTGAYKTSPALLAGCTVVLKMPRWSAIRGWTTSASPAPTPSAAWTGRGRRSWSGCWPGHRRRPAGLDRGFYFDPTVFADVDNRSVIAQEEIFGPVLCVIPADGEDDAVAKANRVRAQRLRLHQRRGPGLRRRAAAALRQPSVTTACAPTPRSPSAR